MGRYLVRRCLQMIPVLAGVMRTTFLSRADIAEWPLVGPVARAIDGWLGGDGA